MAVVERCYSLGTVYRAWLRGRERAHTEREGRQDRSGDLGRCQKRLTHPHTPGCGIHLKQLIPNDRRLTQVNRC